MSYADRLAAAPALAWVWDFPDLSTRFVSELHAGLATPSGWTVFVGAKSDRDSGSSLDVQKNGLTTAEGSYTIPDADQKIVAWLADHEDVIANTRVIRREGLLGSSESEWPITRWILADYGVDSTGGGFQFKLRNVLAKMDAPLYQSDFGGGAESFRLADSVTSLAPGDTTIALDKAPTTPLRAPGYVLLSRDTPPVCELVRYTAVSGSTLTGCTRRYWGVGGSLQYTPWSKDDCSIAPVWVKRGNPLDLMLEWLTTTAAGGNGPHDLGDGDGLGIPVEYFDLDAIHALRDAYYPTPTWNGDALVSGCANLFVESGGIDSLKDFLETKLLQPLGIYPGTDAEERFAPTQMYALGGSVEAIDDDWMVAEFDPSQWVRNCQERVNNVDCEGDYAPSGDEWGYKINKQHPTSVKRYGAAKAVELEGRGMRCGTRAFPDLNGAYWLSIGASRLFLDMANPWTPLKVPVFWRHKGCGIGDAVRLNVPTIPDLTGKRRGVVGAIGIVTRRELDASTGRVEYEIRIRRPVRRAAVVAPNSVSRTYSTANGTDRQYCYLAPAGGSFANGDEAYTVVPS